MFTNWDDDSDEYDRFSDVTKTAVHSVSINDGVSKIATSNFLDTKIPKSSNYSSHTSRDIAFPSFFEQQKMVYFVQKGWKSSKHHNLLVEKTELDYFMPSIACYYSGNDLWYSSQIENHSLYSSIGLRMHKAYIRQRVKQDTAN